MKVLHINGNKEWGGSEQQMFSLLFELDKQEIENIVFSPINSKIHQFCLQNNVTFIGSKSNKLNKFVNYLYLKKIVKSYKPDIIHLHTSDALTVYVLSDFIFRLKTKTVFSKKSMGSKSSYLSKFKYNYINIDIIICISKFIKDDFSKVLQPKNIKKIVIIYDCVHLAILDQKATIDIRKDYLISENTFIVGNIANHNKAKDIKTFILTLDYLVNKLNFKNIKFVQVGYHSSLTPEYLELIEEKKISSYIVFTKAIPQAYSLNSQFDAFFLSSEREGGPTVVLEAMLFGLPIIATKVGFIPEIIKNKVNGFFAEVKDHESLAIALKELIINQFISKEHLVANQTFVKQNFNESIMTAQTIDAYKSLLMN